jgi:hypothetical protein
MTWFRSGDTSMVWALEAVRVWLAIYGGAPGRLGVGFGMGYRRGVNDAKLGDIIKAGHRVNAE